MQTRTRITLTPNDLTDEGRNTPFSKLCGRHFKVKHRTLYMAEYVEYRNGQHILVLKDCHAPAWTDNVHKHPCAEEVIAQEITVRQVRVCTGETHFVNA